MDPLTDRETAETYKRVNEIVREEMEEAVKRQKLRDAAPALAEALKDLLRSTSSSRGPLWDAARAALKAAGYTEEPNE